MSTQIPPDYAPRADLLAGRTILVTGAGDGIGKAVSSACAAHGATVILLGRTVAKLETVYDDIVAAGGPQPAIYPMDLEGATPDDHRQLAENVASQLGRLDGLLHNAGSLGSLTPIAHYDPVEWLRVIHVNLNAPFLLTQSCLPLLERASDASVVFTSSGVGRRGRAYWGAYGASKFGVEGLMQILAEAADTGGDRGALPPSHGPRQRGRPRPGPGRTVISDYNVPDFPRGCRVRAIGQCLPASTAIPFCSSRRTCRRPLMPALCSTSSAAT
jgi:NADP-dependent 3-hydroxy acid dehydrogenase YdfG